MYPNENHRDQIADQIRQLAAQNQKDKKNVDQKITAIMDEIDQYADRNQYLKPTRPFTLAENAIYNLYGTYLLYRLNTTWNVKFDPIYTGDFGLMITIDTTDFYHSNRSLKIYMNTFTDPDINDFKIALYTFDFDRYAKIDGVNYSEFYQWIQIFGFKQHGNKTGISCDAKDLETKFFQFLNLGRYIYEQSYRPENWDQTIDADPNYFAQISHIKRRYQRDEFGHLNHLS